MKSSKLQFLRDIQKDNDNSNKYWSCYEDLIDKFKPLDLRKHYMNSCPNREMNNILSNVVLDKTELFNQYTRDSGHVRLVNILTKLYSEMLGRYICSNNNLLVTMGLTEALFVCISGFIEKGDEVILITPIYRCCKPLILMYGGTVHTCPLKCTLNDKSNETLSKWILDLEYLTSLFNNKTKLIILSNPNYLIGKMYTKTELSYIGNLCKKWNVLCIIDECLELTAITNMHTHMATLPDMWGKTLTIAANGITFGRSGWKVAWIYGTDQLIYNTKVVHQIAFSSLTPYQETLAIVLEKHGLKYFQISNTYKENRDLLMKCFENCGFRYIIPEGGYYIVIEISLDQIGKDLDNDLLAKWLISEFGLLGLPLMNYENSIKENKPTVFVCFSFAQKRETIQLAVKQIEAFCFIK